MQKAVSSSDGMRSDVSALHCDSLLEPTMTALDRTGKERAAYHRLYEGGETRRSSIGPWRQKLKFGQRREFVLDAPITRKGELMFGGMWRSSIRENGRQDTSLRTFIDSD